MTVKEIEQEIERQEETPTDWALQRGVWEIALQLARCREGVVSTYSGTKLTVMMNPLPPPGASGNR